MEGAWHQWRGGIRRGLVLGLGEFLQGPPCLPFVEIHDHVGVGLWKEPIDRRECLGNNIVKVLGFVPFQAVDGLRAMASKLIVGVPPNNLVQVLGIGRSLVAGEDVVDWREGNSHVAFAESLGCPEGDISPPMGTTDLVAELFVVTPQGLDLQEPLLSFPSIDARWGSKPLSGDQPPHPLSVVGASSVAANDTAIELGHSYLPTTSEPVSVED